MIPGNEQPDTVDGVLHVGARGYRVLYNNVA